MEYTEEYGWTKCFMQMSRLRDTNYRRTFPRDIVESFGIGYGSIEQDTISIFIHIEFQQYDNSPLYSGSKRVEPALVVPQIGWNILHSLKLLDYLARIPGNRTLEPDEIHSILERLGFEDWTDKANESIR